MKKFIFLDWVIPEDASQEKSKKEKEDQSFLPGVPFH